MRPLRFSINVTLDGCIDHRSIVPDEEMHMHHTRNIAQADALILGRVTYEMMESAWRPVGETGVLPEGMPAWMAPFGQTIHKIKKYVVSNTLQQVDWNAELIRGDIDAIGERIRALKSEPGSGLGVGGVTLARGLAEVGLIDDFEFVVHPRIMGEGPTLFAGLTSPVDLQLTNHSQFGSGAMVLQYSTIQ